MRVGLFTDAYPPYTNGVSTSVAMLKEGLEKLGHEVYVITTNDDPIRYGFQDNDHVVRLPGISVGALKKYGFRMGRHYSLKVTKMIRGWNLDVIHSHGEGGIGLYAKFVAKELSLPLVSTYHTMWNDYTYYLNKGFFDKETQFVLKELCLIYYDNKDVNELIVPTVKTYNYFKDNYKFERNINIIPTGLKVERFFEENVDLKKVKEVKKKFKVSDKDFKIIFLGRVAKEKNLEFIINMMPKLIKKHKNIRLIVVGDGPDRERCEKLAKDLDVYKNCTFVGLVDQEEVPIYYRLGDVFVLASHSETQGLTVTEAMATGIPVICVEDDSFKWTINDGVNGYLFNTEEECIEKILYLYENKNELEYMGRQARIKAESCDTIHFASAVVDVYERAIKDNESRKYGIFTNIVKKVREKYDSSIKSKK